MYARFVTNIKGKIQTKPASGLANRIARFDHIARSVCNFVKAHSPCQALIEGYSFGSKGRGVFDIGNKTCIQLYPPK